MQDPSAPYNAVYHFEDDGLFATFIARVPRSQIIEYLRNNESVRNRHFRGFRISNAVPTNQQILAAFKKEIVGRHNGGLASSLCAGWIGENEALASVALNALNLQSENPANAYLWINDVQAKLGSGSRQDTVRALVRVLAARFSDEDILIFVSIISSGENQEAVRALVDMELRNARNDPQIAKRRLELELDTARAKIKEIEKLGTGLDSEQTDIIREGEKLEEMLREYGELEGRLLEHEAEAKAISTQLQEVKAKLLECQEQQGSADRQKRSLSTTIDRLRSDLSTKRASLQQRRVEAGQTLDHQSKLLAELDAQLGKVNDQILAEERKKLEQTGVKLVQPVPHKERSSPGKESPQRGPELDKQPQDILGNNAICYQGIQRTFRNAVVAFLRDRFARLFPADHIQRLRKNFGEEWEKTTQNARVSRQILGTATAVRDEYDLLGTNHFFNFFERYYDKIFTTEAGQPENLPKPVKPRFLGNLKAIKDGRDPLSHPVDEEISSQEAQHLLYSCQEILKWLGCDGEAAELAKLADQLDRDEPGATSVLRQLPSEDSIYLEFVGRDILLTQLFECFENPDNKRCLLAGDGGKGKSAVAYRFAQSVSSASGRFQLVVWLSAKKRRFREGSVTTVESPDFTTAEEAINRLLTEYGATKEDMAKPLTYRKSLLLEYLDDFPAFVVADDIDTVLDDDEVVSLFTHEIPHTKSCVLVTSRRAIPGIRAYTVQGFNPVEAEEFLKARIRLYDINSAMFTPTVIAEIRRITDGSPLYMDDLMRLAKVLDIRAAMKIWTEKGGDEARRYALQREFEKLSIDARRILVAAAIRTDPISFAELESILELSEDRLLSALTELQTLFLFPKAPAVEGEQRYQININTKKLVQLVEGPTEFYARIEDRAKLVAGNLHVGQGVVASLIRQALLRLNGGQHGEAEKILLGAIEGYHNAPDLRGVLGLVYRRMGRTTDSRKQFELALRFKSKNPEMYLHWLKLEIMEKEWSKALSVAEAALNILPDAYEIVERKVYVLRQAGFDLFKGMHYEKAKKMWTEAVDVIKQRIKPPEALPPGEWRLNSSMYYSIVVCLDMLNRLRERNQWLERWEQEHPEEPEVEAEKQFLVRKRGTLEVSVYDR